MFILIVDDEEIRHKRFTAIFDNLQNNKPVVMHAYSVAEAQEKLKEFTFDMICLDHDLGHATQDGRVLACWMRDNRIIPPRVLIHSKNTVTNTEMAALLRDKGWNGTLKIIPYRAE